MSGSNDGLRALLGEELQNALHGIRSDVQRLQSDMADAVSRIQSLERSSSWPSPEVLSDPLPHQWNHRERVREPVLALHPLDPMVMSSQCPQTPLCLTASLTRSG